MAYGRGGVRRDWKGPVMLTAMAEVDLSDEEVEWCLRSRRPVTAVDWRYRGG